MMAPHEVVTLVGAIVVAFIVFLLPRREFRRVPRRGLLLSSFTLMCVSWSIAVLDELFLPELLNFLEHLSMGASLVVLIAWCAAMNLSSSGDGR